MKSFFKTFRWFSSNRSNKGINENSQEKMTRDELGYDFPMMTSENLPSPKSGQNNIRYNPTLVKTLKKQHKKLVVLFKEVEKLVREGMVSKDNSDDTSPRFEMAGLTLNQFLQLLKNHVIVENLLLYSFLRKNDPSSNDFGNLQKQMRSIQRTVIGFTNSYVKLGFTKGNARDFLDTWVGKDGNNDAAQISKKKSMQEILTSRILAEEDDGLYMAYDAIGISTQTQVDISP